MSVDNVGTFHRKAEFLEDLITEFLFFTQFIIRIHIFFCRCLICDKIILKGCHIVLSVYRGLRTAP